MVRRSAWAEWHITNPISAANLLGIIPWGSGIGDVSCTGSGVTNCSVNSQSGQVRATFDLAGAAQVDIAGSVTVLPWPDPPQPLQAIVYGPPGLSESDTFNNFGSTPVAQSLFYDGFE